MHSSETKKKTITVAIPTLGRFEEVRNTITGILSGSRIPDEILVSDQNASPIPELDSYLASVSPRVRHLRTEPRGVVFNMNRLLKAAQSDVILYVDDDVIPSSRLVESHLKNYENSKAVGIAGRVEQPQGDKNPADIQTVGAFHPWTGKMIFDFNGKLRQPCVFAQGANMSFDRKALLAIGGFDEGFTGNGYFFESDASLRLAKAHPGNFFFDPDAELVHLAAPRGGARVHDRSIHHAHFTRNGIRLFRKHCPSVVVPLLVLKLFLITLAKAVYRRSFLILKRGMVAIRDGLRQDIE